MFLFISVFINVNNDTRILIFGNFEDVVLKTIHNGKICTHTQMKKKRLKRKFDNCLIIIWTNSLKEIHSNLYNDGKSNENPRHMPSFFCITFEIINVVIYIIVYLMRKSLLIFIALQISYQTFSKLNEIPYHMRVHVKK